MAYKTDPASIGKPKDPGINETVPYLADTDQRWFTEVSKLYPSPEEVWDGTDYMPEQVIRRLATRYFRHHLRMDRE